MVFDCGPSPVTIPVTSTIVFRKETVLDGGGLVTLSGEGAARILLLDSGYDQPRPVSPCSGSPSGRPQRPCRQRRHRLGRRRHLPRRRQPDGHRLRLPRQPRPLPRPGPGRRAPSTPSAAARRSSSASTFIGNSASDGGAVGSLNGDLIIVNSTFTGNQARGSGGNPGQGGCGGAIYQDGDASGPASAASPSAGAARAPSAAGSSASPTTPRHLHNGPQHGRREHGHAGRGATPAASTSRASRHHHRQHRLAQPGLLQRRALDPRRPGRADQRDRGRERGHRATAAGSGSATARPAPCSTAPSPTTTHRDRTRWPAPSSAPGSR